MNGFGIDFGTTNSVAAVCDGRTGKVLAMTNLDDDLPHPSVVQYRGDEIIVGRRAKHLIHGYANVAGNAFVSSVKRKLGKNHSYSLLGERKAAWEVAAEIFHFLKRQARQDYKYDLAEAVLTVPVYYDGHARSELRKAANAAGIEVKTFIHEPFAAVIGYCNAFRGGIEALDGSNVMVFDWGGGTLDITVARIKDARIYETATSGLIDIAGDHFDWRIERFARARFLDRFGLRDDIVSILPQTQARFADESEKKKISLSSVEEEKLMVSQFFEREERSYDLEEPLTRLEFEALIKEDVEAALRQVDKALEEAALSHQEIDKVLLIGGTSRVPMLRREMSARFGARTVYLPNGDTIIAEGASIIAKNGWQPYLERPIQVRLSDGSLYTVFDHGTVLKPEACQKTIHFYCTDNRDGEARLVLVEPQRTGDSSSIQVKRVLSVPVNPRLSRATANERVTVRFEVDEDLEFHASAWGNIDENVASTSIHDLRFGIRVD